MDGVVDMKRALPPVDAEAPDFLNF